MADAPTELTYEGKAVEKPREEKRKSCFNLIGKIITNITVEPVLFLHFVGLLMSHVVVQSLIIRKVCLFRMNLTDETCRNIINNRTLETEAQGYATNFIMYKTVLDTLPSVFWGLFIGSWSDKYGRKALLIVPNVGACVSMLLLALTAFYETEWDENYVLLSSAAFGLTGSMLVMDTGAMSYIADITTPEQRALRYGIVSSALLCGAPIGMSIGALIFKYFNYTYTPVFLISAAIFILNAFYVIFFIKESVDIKKDGDICLDFFNLENVKQTYRTFIQRRENNGRRKLILLLLAVSIMFMPMFAKSNLSYSYTRLKFKWDEVTFSNYSTAELIFIFIGLMVALPVMSNLFKWQDITIGVVSSIAKIISEAFVGIATKGWMLFAASPLFLLSGLTGIIVRTIISKTVSSSEQGKISSIIGIAEGIVPTIGSFILTPLYIATKDTDFPGALYFVTASLTVIPISVLIYISYQRKNIAQQQTASTLALPSVNSEGKYTRTYSTY